MGQHLLYKDQASLELGLLQPTPAVLNSRQSHSIDPLAYSVEFEDALLPEITLFQAALDHVAIQIHSSGQRKWLTRLEHNSLARACFVFEQSSYFGLADRERNLVSKAILMEAVHSALKLIISSPSSDRSLESALKRLGASSQNRFEKKFLSWDDPQNLTNFMHFSVTHEPKLKSGNLARKLHYLSQLSIYTSSPKTPEEYPVTLLVEPEELISLDRIWTQKPLLWDRHALVTESGRLLISKAPGELSATFRKDLGLLIDLHLQVAKAIKRG